MKKIDYSYICGLIGNLTGIPIRVFENNVQTFYHSLVYLSRDHMLLYRDEIFAVCEHIGYFVTPDFYYYGIVNSGKIRIVIGPSRQVASSERDLRELAFRLDVEKDDVEEFITGMKHIIPMPLESIMQTLCSVNYILNDEKLGLGDIVLYDMEQESLLRQENEEKVDETTNTSEVDFKLTIHNSYDVEQTITNIIRKGDVAALSELINRVPAVRAGDMAADQLRQVKNVFVVTATVASRAAIRGGMDVSDAFSWSDAFIQKCEILNSVDRITNLQYHMVQFFTEEVKKVRIGKNPTKLTTDVANYIQHHLSEPITTESIANDLYLSRSHLSRQFKAETGMTLTDFILNEKTEEAKRLLRYTDKSLSSIASYLGFSSQSHFARVFKKYSGRTPGEYKEKYSR